MKKLFNHLQLFTKNFCLLKNQVLMSTSFIKTFFLGAIFFITLSCNSGDNIVEPDPPIEPDRACETSPNEEIANKSYAFSQGDVLWNAFRNRFPYHIQIIGASDIETDSSCTILLSEPAPNVSEDGINGIISCYPHKLAIKQHKIGYDGWVKDVIITLAAISETQLDELKSKLSVYMFNTNYGTYSLHLQTDYKTLYSASLQQKINYQVAPNELETWFCSKDAVMFDGGTIPELLSNSTVDMSILYYSKYRGFVTWILPKYTNIDNRRILIRKFALDADLIIGAIEKNGKIAIIGRERQTSVFDLPPLRTETILQLAAANNTELAQSYERNNIMACKFADGKDWAPIFLSDELLNTEYGSLLNITDQLLKSWSQNGEVTYDNFAYQKPKKWGFEKSLQTLMVEKFNASSVTFNWNTAGAVYQYTKGDNNIIGLNRVGSLPVSYIPDEESSEDNETYKKVEPFEQKGYNFFSNSNDANLVRAAQYAAIYQIFKEFGISSNSTNKSVFNTFKPLESQTEFFINKIKNLTAEEIDNIADNVLKPIKRRVIQQGNFIDDADLKAGLISVKLEYAEDIQNLKQSFKKLDLYPIDKPVIIKMLVNRNAINLLRGDDISEAGIRLYSEITAALSKAGFLKFDFSSLNINADSLRNHFVNYNQRSYSTWIKTPSIVVSKNKDAVESYGGHNIDAALLKVETDINVTKGTIKMQNGIIKVHPEDLERLNPQLLRKLGVETKNAKKIGIKEFSFGSAGDPPKPPRNIKTVFVEGSLQPSGQRGFVSGFHDILEISKGKNYLVNGKEVNTCEALQSMMLSHSIGDDKAAIEFIGFSETNAQVRLKGVELDIKLKTGIDGRFVKINTDNVLNLGIESQAGRINRNIYAFEREPLEGTNISGNSVISVELAAKNNSGNIFVHAEAKSKGLFGKVKDAFVRAFNFSKKNNVDFARKTYEELLGAGLKKSDFALIVSNAKDCVICKANDKAKQNLYSVYQSPAPKTVKLALVKIINPLICLK